MDDRTGRSDIMNGLDRFTYRLFDALGGRENLVVSPYSVSVAMSMAYLGARNRTAAQLAEVLGYPADPIGLTKELSALVSSDSGVVTAISAWLREGLDVDPEYRRNLGTELRPIDFSDNVKAARTISDWATEKTRGLITDLVLPAHIDPDYTLLALVNAIHFLGKWLKGFEKGMTHKGPFLNLDGTISDTDIMFGNMQAGYYHSDCGPFTHDILYLPYADHVTGMLIVVPREFEFFASSFDAKDYLMSYYIASSHMQEINLKMPKFRIESDFDLPKTLAELGAPDAFSPREADFGGMFGGGVEGVHISHVLHKAVVETDEDGTEAAAATAVLMDGYGCHHHIVPFVVVSRPFIFVICGKNGVPLFVGQKVKP